MNDGVDVSLSRLADQRLDEFAERDADERPLIVNRALMLFWAAVLIEFVRTMVVFDYTQPNAMEPAFRASLSFAFGGGVCAWLNVKIGARRDWARMTSLVANVVTAIPSVVWIMQTMATSKVSGWAYIAEMGLNVVAIAFLFTKPARDWFAGR